MNMIPEFYLHDKSYQAVVLSDVSGSLAVCFKRDSNKKLSLRLVYAHKDVIGATEIEPEQLTTHQKSDVVRVLFSERFEAEEIAKAVKLKLSKVNKTIKLYQNKRLSRLHHYRESVS